MLELNDWGKKKVQEEQSKLAEMIKESLSTKEIEIDTKISNI